MEKLADLAKVLLETRKPLKIGAIFSRYLLLEIFKHAPEYIKFLFYLSK